MILPLASNEISMSDLARDGVCKFLDDLFKKMLKEGSYVCDSK